MWKLAFAVACALALTACSRSETPPYRYKLAVAVVCDGSPITAQSISEVVWIDKRSSRWGSVWDAEVRGEAVAIKLCGDAGYLFALRHRLRPEDDPYKTFDPAGTSLAALNGFPSMRELMASTSSLHDQWSMMSQRTRKRDQAILLPENYPLFVRFDDLEDMTSVELVDPANMSDVFGGRVSIESVSIAITEQPASNHIASVLPWLNSLKPETTLSGKPLRDLQGSLADRLSRIYSVSYTHLTLPTKRIV